MIKTQTFPINNLPLSNEMLVSHINRFWDNIFTPLVQDIKMPKGLKLVDKHIMLMCKVEFAESTSGFRTLGHLRKVNYSDKQLFIEYLTGRLGHLTDAYTTQPLSNIIFSYIVKDGLATDRKLLQDLSNKTTTNHVFNNMVLPITMIPSEYGNIVSTQVFDSFTRYIVESIKYSYIIDVNFATLVNQVRIMGASDLKWTDTRLSDGGFMREIGKSTIYFLDGEIVLRKAILPSKPFTRLPKDCNLITSFVTMDIETIKQDRNITPYLICAYNGLDYITSYGHNQVDLFSSFLTQLLTFFNEDAKVLNVYAHNLSGFDGIFLMKHLLSFGKIEPLLFNGRLMSIKVKLSVEGYKGKTIVFKDSMLLFTFRFKTIM